MEVKNLESLLVNETFSALAELQVLLEDKDPVLYRIGMTHSPVRVLAFMILWAGLKHRADKERVVSKLGGLMEKCAPLMSCQKKITVSMLDVFGREISWSEVLDDIDASYTAKVFWSFNVEVPSVNGFLQHVSKENPELYQMFLEKQLIRESGDNSKISVIIIIKNQVDWHQPFGERVIQNLAGEPISVWKVPLFDYQVSESLKAKLQDRPDSGQYGCFEIQAGKGDGVCVYVNTSPKNKKNENILSVDFHDKLIGSGIYDVFMSTQLGGMNYLTVDKVLVELTCAASINKQVPAEGLREPRTFEWNEATYGNHVESTKIIIDMVAYFNDLNMQISFTDKRYALKDIPLLGPEDMIYLRTKSDRWITCLPTAYLPSELLYAVFPSESVLKQVQEMLIFNKAGLQIAREEHWEQSRHDHVQRGLKEIDEEYMHDSGCFGCSLL